MLMPQFGFLAHPFQFQYLYLSSKEEERRSSGVVDSGVVEEK